MRVGILTHYYDSQNFGGNLQAYALCRALNSLGADAEQVSFSLRSQKYDEYEHIPQPPRHKRILKKLRLNYILAWLRAKRLQKWAKKQERIFNISARRKAAFENFNKVQIPHSSEIYSNSNIQSCLENYDAFITGSDQVWNLKWYFKAFFLDFVPSDKIKISYAASISLPELSDSQKSVFKNSLKSFDAVSVREKSAIDLIKDLSCVPVVESLDPTLLLGKDDWDSVASDRIIEGEYIFCYFLGSDPALRKLSKKFAQKRGLKLVNIPHAGGNIKYCDKNFGDINLYDATPNDFLSLVKHAKYVLTDSFHSVVFSYIFKKQFFVFNRSVYDDMNSRIVDICDLFGTQDRYCSDSEKASLKYMCSLPPTDYEKENPAFEAKKTESLTFLKNNLNL